MRRTSTIVFSLFYLFLVGFTGSSALSNAAFSLLKEPDKLNGNLGESRYSIAANQEVVDELVNDILTNKFVNDDSMRKSLEELQAQLITYKENGALSQLRSKSRYSPASTSTPDDSSQSSQDGSLLDKGLKYLRGLFGGDDSQPDDQSTTDPDFGPSSDDESIMEDIAKYLEGVVDSKNGTFDNILRYIVNYVHRNVHFWLFTRNQSGYENLWLGRGSNISKSEFKPWKKTVILVHGWINSGDNNYAQNMVSAYEKFGDFNIISVDWSELSYSFYTLSRLSVNFVGPYVAKMIDFLAGQHDLRVSQLHILGHSLGAHIAGIAGMFVKSGRVGHITGFDPASPLFGNDRKYRLDATDAKFVDVIHTSFLGIPDPLGHADFYPNGGGPSQPGCGLDVAVCPHRRSYQYYIESMTDNNFFAYACDSWDSFTVGNCTTRYVHMGIHAPRRRKGKFYLRTKGEPPYALGFKTLEPVDDPMSRPPQRRHKMELY